MAMTDYPHVDEIASVMHNDAARELARVQQHAETLARAVEQFIARQWPKHNSPSCAIREIAKEDWGSDGCAYGCSLCLLNRALSMVRGRA
jgi:hypothetical protein